MWRDFAPRRLFRAYLPFYPERRRWPPETVFRTSAQGRLPSLCQWAPEGLIAPQGNQAAAPETTATLAAARRRRSLPTQSPSRPVFPWEGLRQSLPAFPGRGMDGGAKKTPATEFVGIFPFGRTKRRGFIPAWRARRRPRNCRSPPLRGRWPAGQRGVLRRARLGRQDAEHASFFVAAFRPSPIRPRCARPPSPAKGEGQVVRQPSQLAKASTGGQAQTRLRSPATLSMRDTGGQYFVPLSAPPAG